MGCGSSAAKSPKSRRAFTNESGLDAGPKWGSGLGKQGTEGSGVFRFHGVEINPKGPST